MHSVHNILYDYLCVNNLANLNRKYYEKCVKYTSENAIEYTLLYKQDKTAMMEDM